MGPCIAIDAFGPRHFVTASQSVSPTEWALFGLLRFAVELRVFVLSSTVALGHDEQSLAPHGISGCGRAEYSCRNAVAQCFQCRDDGFELSVRVPRDVLADDKIRPALAGDPADLGGEEAFSVGSGPCTCDAVVLAGISRSEDMNDATPWSSVEGEHVGPDRSRMKPPCVHRRDQACGGCGFPLHVTDAASNLSPMVKGEQDSELQSADPGAEGEDVLGTYSHVTGTSFQTQPPAAPRRSPP